MITYRVEFEEMPSGTMRIHLESPPAASTTPKEQHIAKAYADHVKAILETLRKECGGQWQIQN
jgi:hypothetical protein